VGSFKRIFAVRLVFDGEGQQITFPSPLAAVAMAASHASRPMSRRKRLQGPYRQAWPAPIAIRRATVPHFGLANVPGR
jgi:hypothetical protein